MSPPRLHVDQPLTPGSAVTLPPGPARHVQVLRLQPGAVLTLFNGQGGEWRATVRRIGRSDVDVDVGEHRAVDRELAVQVTLALGMPANDRMDALVEKATELGVAAIQPLLCERSVLRLHGERADRKVAHWHGVAVAAAEQCGRTRLPEVAPVRSLADWLGALPGVAAAPPAPTTPAGPRSPRPAAACRVLLSLDDAASPFVSLLSAEPPVSTVCLLSGPEGGLTDAEQAAACAAGFRAAGLGPRTLRADTAPLAALAALALIAGMAAGRSESAHHTDT